MYVFFMSSMAYLFIFLIVSFDKHKFYNFKEVLFKKQETWGFPGGSDGKASACNAGDPGLIPGSGRALEKEMATHSCILAWKIPWMEEPSGLQSMGSQRVGHD